MCQQDGLVLRRLCYAAAANVGTVASGQHHIDQLNPAQLLEHATRFMAQPGSFASLTQRFPKNVGQEADQDVGKYSLFFLMPDRTQPEIAFVDAETPPRPPSTGCTLSKVLRRSSPLHCCEAGSSLRSKPPNHATVRSFPTARDARPSANVFTSA